MHSSGSGNSVKLRIIYKDNQNLLRHSLNLFVKGIESSSTYFFGGKIFLLGRKLFCVGLWISEGSVVVVGFVDKETKIFFYLLEKLNAWFGEMILNFLVVCNMLYATPPFFIKWAIN